jgi:glycosyltransferase involved in cell wall biosynthesis
MARLHPRKRAMNFVSAAAKLLAQSCAAQFTLIGPDEGDGTKVRSAIDAVSAKNRSDAELRWLGPIAPDEALERLSQAYAYVLPSVDEPFPMSVIEAMAAGRPVIVTESNGLAAVVRNHRCGVVVADDAVDELACAIDYLLRHPDVADKMGARALSAVGDEFSIGSVADKLEDRYRICLPAPHA